jgi:hypothetical protein
MSVQMFTIPLGLLMICVRTNPHMPNSKCESSPTNQKLMYSHVLMAKEKTVTHKAICCDLPLAWPSPLSPVQASLGVLSTAAAPVALQAPTGGVFPSAIATLLLAEILPTHFAQQAKFGTVVTSLSFLVL